MNKNLRVGLGLVVFVVGLIWTLQGLDILHGSPMTGHTLWAVVGPIVAVAGAWLAAGALRADRR